MSFGGGDPLLERFQNMFGRAPANEMELQAFAAQDFSLGSAPAPMGDMRPAIPHNFNAAFKMQPTWYNQAMDAQQRGQASDLDARVHALSTMPTEGYVPPARTGPPMPSIGAPPGMDSPPGGAFGATDPEGMMRELGPLGSAGGAEDVARQRVRLAGGASGSAPVPSIGAGRGASGGGGLPTAGGSTGSVITNMMFGQEQLRLQEEDAKRQAVAGLLQSLIGGVGGLGLGGI